MKRTVEGEGSRVVAGFQVGDLFFRDDFRADTRGSTGISAEQIECRLHYITGIAFRPLSGGGPCIGAIMNGDARQRFIGGRPVAEPIRVASIAHRYRFGDRHFPCAVIGICFGCLRNGCIAGTVDGGGRHVAVAIVFQYRFPADTVCDGRQLPVLVISVCHALLCVAVLSGDAPHVPADILNACFCYSVFQSRRHGLLTGGVLTVSVGQIRLCTVQRHFLHAALCVVLILHGVVPASEFGDDAKRACLCSAILFACLCAVRDSANGAVTGSAEGSFTAIRETFGFYPDAVTFIQNIMAAVEKGVVTATTTSRLLELETTLNELEQKIAVEKCKQPVRLTREQIRTYYGKALKLEPQLLISYLVRRIVLFDDRAEIEYNTPIDTTSGDGRGILLDTIGRDYTAYSVANEGRQVTKHMDIDIKI